MCIFTAGNCRFGKDCRDLHGDPSSGKGKGEETKGKGKGKDKPPAATAAAAPAISILRKTRRSPESVPSSVALAASNYDLGPRENYRSWLLDTGCKHDLTTRASIPLHTHDLICRAPIPILLATANDLVNGDKVIQQQIGN